MATFIADNWGSLASVSGLLVSLVGFTSAIIQIRRSHSAATEARDAAVAARQTMARNLTIADLTRARDRMQTLKDLHRIGPWERALDRYDEVRRMLVEIRGRHPGLTSQQLSIIQNAVVQVGIMEGEVRAALREGRQPDIARFDATLSETQATLDELSVRLEQSG